MSADELDELRKKVDEIHKALLGDFECQGLFSRMRKLEDRSAFVNKMLLGIGLSTASLIINTFWTLLVK